MSARFQKLKAERDRIVSKLYRELEKDCKEDRGRGMFSGSIDMPTLCITHPVEASRLNELETAMRRER